jgi:hypothetical protein
MSGVSVFIQKQILGMDWLRVLVGYLLEKAGLDLNGKMGGTIQFFLYDVLKITILLCLLIFLVVRGGLIQPLYEPSQINHANSQTNSTNG